MFQLFFKHLLPYYSEWEKPPFAPWEFGESVLFSVINFFESNLDDFKLQEVLQSKPIFMDSGAFAAESMGFQLDPFEVAEMHSLLKADLIVPLDRIILATDSEKITQQKVAETLKNTEILLDYCPNGSEVVGSLQGLSPDLVEIMFFSYRELGIKSFALGGLVFQEDLSQTIGRIKSTREITQSYFLHIFGKFLHPRLLKPIIKLGCDSVDGYGYILNSIRGLYIDFQEQNYTSIAKITETDLDECSCLACENKSLSDFQRGDEESQYLLIIHNIHALIKLKNFFCKKVG